MNLSIRVRFLAFAIVLFSVRAQDARRVFFGIAVAPSAQSYARAFNKTLQNITQTYLGATEAARNVAVETLAIEVPENGGFSATLLRTLCDQFEGKHVVAVLVVGDTPAAFTVSLVAREAGIPVLWARGHSGFLPGLRSLVSCLIVVVLDFLLCVRCVR